MEKVNESFLDDSKKRATADNIGFTLRGTSPLRSGEKLEE
jgi:hypothetical protein